MAGDPQPIANALRTFFASETCRGDVCAYLFGSYGRAAPHRESDVDVGVLLDWGAYPTRERRFERRVRLSSELGHVLRRNDVDVVILNDAPPLLARRIVTEGHRIHCADADLCRAFVRDVQLRAADLEPFLRRMRRIKLEVMGR